MSQPPEPLHDSAHPPQTGPMTARSRLYEAGPGGRVPAATSHRMTVPRPQPGAARRAGAFTRPDQEAVCRPPQTAARRCPAAAKTNARHAAAFTRRGPAAVCRPS
ncbi:hypothetical protein GCM10022214_82700 [Actinomadura miaoliensis]|uniref:Uncharacterized protein n=1 Tax=Actinomadura miaoliensis TaxID=430685 RepID=A0ABP7X3H1_9ACTN